MDANSGPNEKTAIQQFYAGSTIFITGGTGFVGIILIEKLLRSCPDISKIYVMVRTKKGVDGQTRLNEMFSDLIYERLAAEQPDFRQKVFPISGDCIEPNMGLKPEDMDTIINEVNIVFHLAATVNFEAKLQTATLINIRATRDMIAILKRMNKLKFMVYVSTAYTYCHLKELKESFYPCKVHPHELITLAETLPDEMQEKITKPMLGDFPNTYTMTKSASEELFSGITDLPIAIFKPAIIVSTYKEPIPGWINNLYGPQGVCVAAMLGVLRTLHCDEEIKANIVPVDMCVNALIAIPWDARLKYDEAEKQKETYEIPLYNYESYSYNPLNWKMLKEFAQINGRECPSVKMVGNYYFVLNKYKFVHNIYVIFLHSLPAFIIDNCLKCIGKKPMLTKAYEKIHRFCGALSYFCTANLHFVSKRLDELNANMSEADKRIFFCNLRELNWPSFFKIYLLGCRTYLVKDPVETIPDGKKLYWKFRIFTRIFLCFLAFLLYSLVRFLWGLFNF